jgi:hypothetical protein
MGLVGRVDEGQPDLPEAQIKLGQYRMPEGLSGDACPVRDEKYGSVKAAGVAGMGAVHGEFTKK